MNTHREGTALALARYAVIAPSVSRVLTKAELDAEVRRATATVHRFPNGEKTVSPRNHRRWRKWYLEGRTIGDRVISPGLQALEPIVRDDKGEARKIDPALIARAIELRTEENSRTNSALVELLRAEAVARNENPPDIEEATLAYHLRNRGATRRIMKKDTRVYPRFQHAHRNDCWQGDMTGGMWLPDPHEPKKLKQVFLHAFIDDRTRRVPHAEFYDRQNQVCLMDCFRKAVIAGGLCSMAYWDNGSAYQSQQVELMAARLGIQVVFATPYHPQGKGKIERFFGHLKTSFYPEARRANLQSLSELNEFLWGWLDVYHDKEHSELKATPRELWNAEDGLVRWPDVATLGDAFLWEDCREVDRTGCIHLDGNAYPVPEHLVGQKVSILFDPFDLSRVRVYHKGAYVDTVAPHELKAQTHRKAAGQRIEKPGPLDSAVTYRKQLSQHYRRRVQDFTEPAGSPRGNNDCLNQTEFAELLAERLVGRILTAEETRVTVDFFVRYAPLSRQDAMRALQAAIEDKGVHRHLRFYLDAVRSTRRGGKREV